MKCPQCKKEIDDGSSFCMHCGSKIGVADLVKNILETQSGKEKANPLQKYARWKKSAITIIAFLAMFFAYWFGIRTIKIRGDCSRKAFVDAYEEYSADYERAYNACLIEHFVSE